MRYVYSTSPVDYWDGWNPVEFDQHGNARSTEQLSRLSESEGNEWCEEFSFTEDEFYLAVGDILQEGWEKDGKWRWSVLPCPEEFTSIPLFAVKQSNNGTCFFWARVPLIHLQDDYYDPPNLLLEHVARFRGKQFCTEHYST